MLSQAKRGGKLNAILKPKFPSLPNRHTVSKTLWTGEHELMTLSQKMKFYTRGAVTISWDLLIYIAAEHRYRGE